MSKIAQDTERAALTFSHELLPMVLATIHEKRLGQLVVCRLQFYVLCKTGDISCTDDFYAQD